MTSKLQVTVPKAIADRYRIKPGDEIAWIAAGESIRVLPVRRKPPERAAAFRLRAFDEASVRQAARNKSIAASTESRGWTREELYERGGSR